MKLLSLIALAFVACVQTSSWGVTYRVDNSKSTNPGANRYDTFTELVQNRNLNGGDTVLVYGTGTPYKEQFAIIDDGSHGDDGGSTGQQLRILGVGNPVIDGGWIDTDRNGVDDDVDNGVPESQAFFKIGSNTHNGTIFHTTTMGLIHVEDAKNVLIEGITVCNSQQAGISVLNENHGQSASDISIQDCTITDTRSCGIVIIAKKFRGSSPPGVVPVEDVVIKRNKVSGSNLAVNEPIIAAGGQAANEAITLVQTHGFDVYDNEVFNHWKEGIDAKEGSEDGRIYGNLVRDREPDIDNSPFNDIGYPDFVGPGIYIDGADEGVSDIKVYGNVVTRCGQGITVASESGGDVLNIDVFNNISYDNWRHQFCLTDGAGTNTPGLRQNVRVYNNTFVGDASAFGGPTFPATALTNVICISPEKVQSKLNGFEFVNNIVTRRSPASTDDLIWSHNLSGTTANDPITGLPFTYISPTKLVTNNLFYNHGINDPGFQADPGFTAYTTINPNFNDDGVWVGNRSFYVPFVDPSSATGNKGTKYPLLIQTVPDDFDGNARYTGSNYDLGPFESY